MNPVLRAAAAIRVARGEGASLERRRQFADEPFAYARDVYGYRLTNQQEAVLEAARRWNRILIPAAQNVGKSWILGLIALWLFDARGALPGPEGQQQQGARILLPGPDSDTVFQTLYSKILGHAIRAHQRGWRLPGAWSERSVLWRVPGYPEWTMESLTPPKSVSEKQSHKAAGRHHVNQHAIVEEGIGVPESVWASVERMCSGSGNKIISAYNPTEPVGPTITRERTGTYQVLRLSALEHPNVQTRSTVVPGAISHEEIDETVRVHTLDQGPWPGTPLDPDRGDFVFALPTPGALEAGPRKDGVPGHALGQTRVRRPLPVAEVAVLGRTAAGSETGLFTVDAIQRSAARWKANPDPTRAPDRVGVDPARTGSDDSTAAPGWGESAESLLRAYHDAQQKGPAAIERLQAERRIRVGSIAVLPKGDGKVVADALWQRWPGVPFSVDDGGVSTAPIDILRHVHGAQVGEVSFGGQAPSPPPQGQEAENMRTHMYLLLAMLLARDLVDLPPDTALHEELLAHQLEYRTKTVKTVNGTRRVTSVLLESKDRVKGRIGRSPDRSDGAVLAVTEPVASAAAVALPQGEQGAEYGKLRANYNRPGGFGLSRRRR